MEKLQKAEIKDKKIVVRIDCDVATKDAKVIDDYRLKAALPTLKYLIGRRPERIIVLGHRGRPHIKHQEEPEEVRGNNPELILKPVAERFKELLGYTQNIEEINIDGFPAYRVSKDVYILENVRFDWRETHNDDNFSKSLSQLGQIFVFDAFASAHRSHASTKGIQKFIPSFLGLRCQKEIQELSKLKKDPDKPLVVAIGGVKIEDKQPVIVNLLKVADKILIGGKLANSIYEARFAIHNKADVKNLLKELEKNKQVKRRDDPVEEILTSGKIVLPEDGILESGDTVKFNDIRQGMSHLIPEVRDIGPKAAKEYKKIISTAKTFLWAGPMGMYEQEPFSNGTKAIIEAIDESDVKAYAAGGDTHQAIEAFKGLGKFDFISVGGGAALDYLADKSLTVFSGSLFEK